jgi:outer membrane protein
MRRRLASIVLLAPISGAISGAQEARRLTLEQAEELAVKNHPRIASASLSAQAAGTTVTQVRSALQPLVTGNLTTVGADRGTAIAAGTLQTSGLASRAATGVAFSQLITDFGRTSTLADSARLRAAAQDRNVATTRAEVLLQVDQAYYHALAAESVLKVAQARVEVQRLTLRQVRTLAENSLRSTLDVGFAEVAVSEAELALYQAENAAKASQALLAAAIGDEKDAPLALADVPLPARPSGDREAMVEEAVKNRPDLAVAKLNQSAAERQAEAEKKLRYPAISAVGVVGAVPFRQNNLANQYSAAGLNVSIPFLNGGLFAARREEAELRARAADKDTAAIAVQIAGSVRVAWLEAENAWRRIDVTARLVDQAVKTLRLAKTRYDIGLSGILELTQAQLSETSAQIAAATAKYDYLSRVAALNYAIGAYR